MPTYEYVCEKCGHQFDKFQSMLDSALTVCPKDRCSQKKWGKGRVKKLISGGAGLLFKGSGFYITDYRSDKYHAAAKKDSSTPATPASVAGTTTAAPSSGGDAKPKTPSAPAKAAGKSPPAAKAKS
jgi:putative FmdB family regulatory protein